MTSQPALNNPAATTSVPKVAIVDLDRRVQVALAEALRTAGLDVVGTAGEPSQALTLVKGGTEVIVIDPRLPELADGRALVDEVCRTWPDVRIVLMGWSDYGDSRLSERASAFVSKAATPEEFVVATIKACASRPD